MENGKLKNGKIVPPSSKIDPVHRKNGDLEILLQRSQSSVMVKKDAKGNLSYEIKVYADTVEEAVRNAQQAKDDLENRLGMAE